MSAGTSTVTVLNILFNYSKQSEELFNGLTHKFAKGKITALIGGSGRGKSTLLYILGLLLTAKSGDIHMNGMKVSHLSDREKSRIRARKMGFVFQDSELDPFRTVLDSILEPGLYAELPRGELVVKAHELLERFELNHRALHRPGQVSGGQAQRLALCRALITSPEIVLADEPTGNLDQANAVLVLDVLKEMAHVDGRTVVIATHDPYIEGVADEVVEL